MFGRVRTASSSPDSLESHASKLLKQDSLSIYEATLLKLKLGSQHGHSKQAEAGAGAGAKAEASPFTQENDAARGSSDDPMALDSNSNPTSDSKTDEDPIITFSSRAGTCNTSTDLQQQRGGNMSVLYLFSKYKTSVIKSTQNEMMKLENESSSKSISLSSSHCPSQCPSLQGINRHLESEMECVS